MDEACNDIELTTNHVTDDEDIEDTVDIPPKVRKLLNLEDYY